MGCNEDDEGGVFDYFFQSRGSDEVTGKGDVGKVTGVKVGTVDSFSEFLSVYLNYQLLFLSELQSDLHVSL